MRANTSINWYETKQFFKDNTKSPDHNNPTINETTKPTDKIKNNTDKIKNNDLKTYHYTII